MATTKLICANCGAKYNILYPENWLFCPRCGASMTPDEPEPAPPQRKFYRSKKTDSIYWVDGNLRKGYEELSLSDVIEAIPELRTHENFINGILDAWKYENKVKETFIDNLREENIRLRAAGMDIIARIEEIRNLIKGD